MFEGLSGPDLTAALASCQPEHLGDDELVDIIQAWERSAAWVAAGQLAAIAELCLAGRRSASRSAKAVDPVAPMPGIGARRR